MSIIETRLRPDPYLTDAEFYARRQRQLGPAAGYVPVRVNLSEAIGGLARIRHSQSQEEAAAKFRGLWERAQIGGARAIDYAAVKVDTSGPSTTIVTDHGLAARRGYTAAVRHLGIASSSLVERVVIYDMPISRIAGIGARARARTTDALLVALDDLAVHFGLAQKRA